MSGGKNIFVTGVPKAESPQVGVRQEIHTLLANPKMRNLYILGMERFQKRNENDPKSWYQVAGIHGRPYRPWNGETDKNGKGNFGYCTHSSILFLTWHRAYLALFEQCFFDAVQEVAKEFGDSNIEKLAKTFRIPYWDWASKPILGKDLTSPKITVRRPKATSDTEIENPLARYRFQKVPVSDLGNAPWSTWPTTLRWPNNRTPQAQSMATEMTEALEEFITTAQRNRDIDSGFPTRGKLVNLRDRLYGILNIVQQDPGQTFKGFASNRWDPNGVSSDYASAEAVHDWLHGMLGRGGHMGSVPVAAFDPIFWLHHCNIDRVWGLWQALHPKADANWVLGEVSGTAWTFGEPETESIGLLPFRKDASSLWTSKDTKNLTLYNNTYPELTNWGIVSREQLRSEVTRIVRSLYGPATPSARIADAIQAAAVEPLGLFTVNTVALTPVAPIEESEVKAEAKEQAVFKTPEKKEETPTFQSVTLPAEISTAEIPLTKVVIPNTKTHREYFANIRARKYVFGGTFSVHFFIGQFTSEARLRPSDPNLVGTFTVFATEIDDTQCQACLEGHEKGLVVTGQIPLTGALLDRIEQVSSLEKEDVTAFLREHLHWRLHREDLDHTNISRHELKNPDDLKVSVTSCLVDIPDADDQLPLYRDWNPIPQITEGRPTGTGFDDTEGFVG